MKHYTSLNILGFALISLAACENMDYDFDTHNTDRVYMPKNVFLDTIYDAKNTDTWSDTVYVKKNGTQSSATVALKYDTEAINSYVADNGDGQIIKALPEGTATLSTNTVHLPQNAEAQQCIIKFDLVKLREVIAGNDNRDAKLVYPVSLSLENAEGVEITSGKSYIIAGLDLLAPQVLLDKKGELNNKKIDLFHNYSPSVMKFPIKVSLPYNNNKETFKISYKVSEADLTAYNTAHGTDYTLLPSNAYTLPSSLTIEAGKSEGSINVEVNTDKLPKDVGGAAYMLPIRLTDSGNDNVPMEANAVTYVTVNSVAKYTGDWYVNILTETNLGTTNNTGGTVKIYSYRDCKKNLQNGSFDANFISNFNALEKNANYEAIRNKLLFGPGWAAYWWDQASQVFMVTDEDFDNTGKKKVEIVSGYMCGFLYPERIKTSDNKSWYDPAKNEIHLEYKGYVYWGGTDMYSVNRTFSSQQIE